MLFQCKLEDYHQAENALCRTIESLFEELAVEGVIVKHQKVQLSDFIGEYSFLGTTLRQANIEPMPSLSDIRRIITEFAVLPLGSSLHPPACFIFIFIFAPIFYTPVSDAQLFTLINYLKFRRCRPSNLMDYSAGAQAVHEKSPLIRSLMLCGPRGAGKNMLVDTSCTETDSILIDISAANIAGKYPGKDGLKMLTHLIFKVILLLTFLQSLFINAVKLFPHFYRKIPNISTIRKIPNSWFSSKLRSECQYHSVMKLWTNKRWIELNCQIIVIKDIVPLCIIFRWLEHSNLQWSWLMNVRKCSKRKLRKVTRYSLWILNNSFRMTIIFLPGHMPSVAFE